MMNFRRKHHFIPDLNTAALPDLIFTVLFFFMIVTHMRKVDVKVKYKVPQGTELTRLTNKSSVIHIYIGAPMTADGSQINATRIQVNNKIVSLSDIVDYVSAERERMSVDDVQHITASITADQHTKMSTINQVKHALRQANILNISYSASSKPVKKNLRGQ